MAERVDLIGDIGGTNARFALIATDRGYTNEMVFNCADFSGAAPAISAYLDTLGMAQPRTIYLATAGHVSHDQCQFTNNDWRVSADELQSVFAADAVLLLNDFVAVAHGLPYFDDNHLVKVGGPASAVDMTGDVRLGVLGPGTGLGVGALIRQGAHTTVLASEAGHMAFAPETRLQREVLAVLAAQFSRVSIERLLSGPGVSNLYEALGQVVDKPVAAKSAAEIFADSQRYNDALERQTTDLFFALLGQVAGDLSLAFGIEQGMYIAGGIVQRYPQMLLASSFRQHFENKGRHRALLERVPTWLIEHVNPGLFGVAEFARRQIPTAP